ncbi:hypothetical protein SNEBB_010876 [Seison nebaliae]|nr:hypothetical protein SNEBB_010876 [Seison nebaliae]
MILFFILISFFETYGVYGQLPSLNTDEDILSNFQYLDKTSMFDSKLYSKITINESTYLTDEIDKCKRNSSYYSKEEFLDDYIYQFIRNSRYGEDIYRKPIYLDSFNLIDLFDAHLTFSNIISYPNYLHQHLFQIQYKMSMILSKSFNEEQIKYEENQITNLIIQWNKSIFREYNNLMNRTYLMNDLQFKLKIIKWISRDWIIINYLLEEYHENIHKNFWNELEDLIKENELKSLSMLHIQAIELLMTTGEYFSRNNIIDFYQKHLTRNDMLTVTYMYYLHHRYDRVITILDTITIFDEEVKNYLDIVRNLLNSTAFSTVNQLKLIDDDLEELIISPNINSPNLNIFSLINLIEMGEEDIKKFSILNKKRILKLERNVQKMPFTKKTSCLNGKFEKTN